MSIFSSVINKMLANTKRSVIEKKIALFLKDQNNQDAVIDNMGAHLSHLVRTINRGFIKSASEQMDLTVEFYMRNEKGLKLLGQAMDLLITEENIADIKKSGKMLLATISTELSEEMEGEEYKNRSARISEYLKRSAETLDEINNLGDEKKSYFVSANNLTETHLIKREDVDVPDAEYNEISNYLITAFGETTKNFVFNRFNNEDVVSVTITKNKRTDGIELTNQYK
jgi:hypothetical protein